MDTRADVKQQIDIAAGSTPAAVRDRERLPPIASEIYRAAESGLALAAERKRVREELMAFLVTEPGFGDTDVVVVHRDRFRDLINRVLSGEGGDAAQLPPMQLRCWKCGKPVSTPVPSDTVVRGTIECPECVPKEG